MSGLIIPEKRMTPATGLEAPLKVLEIGLVVYDIGQSDSAPGVLNTITVTLQFADNTEFAGDNTRLIISGLKSTLAPAGTVNITCMTGQCARICENLLSDCALLADVFIYCNVFTYPEAVRILFSISQATYRAHQFWAGTHAHTRGRPRVHFCTACLCLF